MVSFTPLGPSGLTSVTTGSPLTLTVVIPALNEEAGIGSTIERCLEARAVALNGMQSSTPGYPLWSSSIVARLVGLRRSLVSFPA